MKRLILVISALVCACAASAQTESEKLEKRYDALVARLGADGIGVETVLNNWEAVDSTNAKMLLGKFSYYFTKSQTPQVVAKPQKKYLGMEPVITLKDSLGNDVYYYQENMFDDEMYGLAVKAADKAIASHPDRLDLRFMKANAYIAYEKESPDMALAYLQDLVRENQTRTSPWFYEEEKLDEDFFEEAMQEYCYSFFTIGSQASYEAFRTISEQLLKIYPKNTGFMNNIGSYYLVKQEYKTALKNYDKVLKKKPGDTGAIQNAITASRRLQNVKMEKKYLNMMVKHGSERERLMAQGRLNALNR